MSRGWQWKSGDWYVSCQVCSKQVYASESKKRWDGLIVCPDDYECRHPQELIRVRPERQSVPFTSIEPNDVFVDVDYPNDYMDGDYVQEEYIEIGEL